MTNYRKDGSEFTVDLSLFPVADAEGWYTHWIGIQRDTTEQTLMRERLAAEESRLHFLTESMPQLLWTASATGQCEFISNSCARFMGRQISEVLGNGWHKSIHPEDLDRTYAAWMESIETGAPFVTEYRLRRFDGEYIWFLHRAVPRRNDEGAIMEWIGSSTDIAQQKRNELAIRQAEKLAAVGRLASSVAHEINNPLTSVTNLLYLLSTRPSLDRISRQYVSTAQEELSRVTELTSQTLRFHKQSTNPELVHISEMLEPVLEFFRPRFTAAGILVLREYDEAKPIHCLSGEIRQLVSSLISNAVDAIRAGGRIRVRVRESVSWPHRKRLGVRITIADTGKGITRSSLPNIFDPFFTTKPETGTGLGLWISKGIVSKHEGLISIWSSTLAGRTGTAVSVFLPYERNNHLTEKVSGRGAE